MDIDKITDVDSAIRLYASIVSEDRPEGRREIHKKLCELLGFPYSNFKPFDGFTIDNVPRYGEAVRIIKRSIASFKMPRLGAEPCLHCGCCEVRIASRQEWDAHVRTAKHLRNAITACGKELADPHATKYIREQIEKMKRGEQTEFSTWAIYYRLKKLCEIQLLIDDMKLHMSEFDKTFDEYIGERDSDINANMRGQ